MRSRVLSLIAIATLLAACETAPQQAGTGSGTGGVSPSAVSPVAVAPVAQPAQPPGPRPGSQEDLVASLGDRVFFDFDKSDLRPEARARLDTWAGWLRRFPNVSLKIEGHCDERGTREYNLGLGDRRANSVKRYLVSLGIDTGRVRTISYGKERPAVLGSNEAAWSQNRRGVAVVN